MTRVLFLNLTAFSQTGGLEKFNRSFLRALYELQQSSKLVTKSYSLYDTTSDEKYYPRKQYSGFRKSRIPFVLKSIFALWRNDIVVLGHINLAIIGSVIKLIAPGKKIVLICHGIEVWQKLTGVKKRVLEKSDRILAVSSYTKQKLIEENGVDEAKVTIFHNTVDPYFALPDTFGKDASLLKRYGLADTDFVLYTLGRLSSNEQYKGYDYVVEAIGALVKRYPNIKYIIGGKYDDAEKKRMDGVIERLGLQNNIIFTGYIKDNEIIAHYQLADVYIMPSRGEGFGIVFIEALSCGVRVIGGNADGTVDALKNGELGLLVNPQDSKAIAAAIEKYIVNSNRTPEDAKQLQKRCIDNFGFNVYKNRLDNILSGIINN
ncbi:MAG: glycosyltransferase family 4 protein [Bacteroidetes bacterium]|nr:glycosyltransferase family 4 protein [Bacteroidota bacterium]